MVDELEDYTSKLIKLLHLPTSQIYHVSEQEFTTAATRGSYDCTHINCYDGRVSSCNMCIFKSRKYDLVRISTDQFEITEL